MENLIDFNLIKTRIASSSQYFGVVVGRSKHDANACPKQSFQAFSSHFVLFHGLFHKCCGCRIDFFRRWLVSNAVLALVTATAFKLFYVIRSEPLLFSLKFWIYLRKSQESDLSLHRLVPSHPLAGQANQLSKSDFTTIFLASSCR